MGSVTIELEVKIAYLVIRQIAHIINTARSYEATIQIRNVTRDTPFVNAVDMMGMLGQLNAAQGDIVELKAEGEDAAEAIEAIRELFDSFDKEPEE